MSELMNFVKPELLVLVPVLLILGKMLKNSSVPDKYIPAALGVCGIVLAVVWVVGGAPLATYQDILNAIFAAVTQGIITAGLAVYGNQLVKQAGKEE